AIPFADRTLVGTTEIEVSALPAREAFRPSLEEVRYLRAELERVLPGSKGASPIALSSGIRPLVRSDSGVDRASREHRLIEDGPVLTLVGGKFTTFRPMARDALASLAPRLGRDRSFEDSDAPLPRPLEPSSSLAALAEFAVREEFARRLEDVMRRRTRLWLALDRGRGASGAIVPVMAMRLGWSAERTRSETQSWEASLWEEETLRERARSER